MISDFSCIPGILSTLIKITTQSTWKRHLMHLVATCLVSKPIIKDPPPIISTKKKKNKKRKKQKKERINVTRPR